MYLTTHALRQNRPQVLTPSQSTQLFYSPNAGRLVRRKKLGAWHYGIEAFIDCTHRIYFIHNHPEHGKACIVSESMFASGKFIERLDVACNYNPIEVVERAVLCVQNEVEYNLLTNNCETLVNWACNNQPKSLQVQTGLKAAGLAIGGFVLYRLFKK